MVQDRNAWTQTGRIGSFGLVMGIAMLVCGGVGVFVDRVLGTAPVMTAILFLGGGAAAFWYGIVNILK
ncbi:MAG: AtpZ/AtpI family protein [Candidatus Coatesbacteria bacterium]